MEVANQEQTPVDIMNKAVILALSKRYIGTTKSVRPDKVKIVKESESQVDTDARWMSTSKTLFSSKKLWDIYAADTRIDNLLTKYCLPSVIRRSNTRILPAALVPEVDAILVAHLEERERMVEEFCSPEEYESAIAKAKEKLGPLWNEEDYLPLDVVRKQFAYSWQYLEFNVSSQLKTISADILKREQKKLEEHWVEAGNSIRALLRANMADLVSHMAERLSPTADGKKRVFKTSSLTNIQDFIATFDARNLSGDTDLKALVDKVQALTKGLDPELLRGDESMRINTQKQFESVKTELDKLVIAGPSRFIELE
jgi:hypothetical protein